MESLCGAVPRFPRMKCAIKPTLRLVVSSPGDAALLVTLGPHGACGTVPVPLPRSPPALRNSPGPSLFDLAQATQGKRGRCVVSWPLFSDKIHPVSPLALRSSVPLPGASKRGSEKQWQYLWPYQPPVSTLLPESQPPRVSLWRPRPAGHRHSCQMLPFRLRAWSSGLLTAP